MHLTDESRRNEDGGLTPSLGSSTFGLAELHASQRRLDRATRNLI